MDLPFLEVLDPPLMLIMQGLAHFGHCGIRFTHHGVRIPSNLAMVHPREISRLSIR